MNKLALMVALLSMLVVPARAATTCDGAPPAVRDLDLGRYYTDAIGSEINETKQAEKRAAVAPLKRFMAEVAQGGDRVWRSNTPQIFRATCPLAWLTAWASGGALLGDVASKQAAYERNWALAGLAISYVKLRPFATPEQRDIIDAWLSRVADAAQAFFEDRARKRNNHWYWLGLGLAAVGLATDSERHWIAARGIMMDAANAIQADGTLPMELARGRRAMHYHNFAAQPLFAMSLLARAKGENWLQFNDGAFDRLAHAIYDADCGSTQQPGGLFSVKTGVRQHPIHMRDLYTSWLPIYLRLADATPKCWVIETDRLAWQPRKRPSNFHRLGGDLSTLINALEGHNK